MPRLFRFDAGGGVFYRDLVCCLGWVNVHMCSCQLRIPLCSIMDWHRITITVSHPFNQPGSVNFFYCFLTCFFHCFHYWVIFPHRLIPEYQSVPVMRQPARITSTVVEFSIRPYHLSTGYWLTTIVLLCPYRSSMISSRCYIVRWSAAQDPDCPGYHLLSGGQIQYATTMWRWDWINKNDRPKHCEDALL